MSSIRPDRDEPLRLRRHGRQRTPDGVETCNGIDDDCDGVVDLDAPEAALRYPDADGDGHGDPSMPTWVCGAAEG
jgi:hypothetical protein